MTQETKLKLKQNTQQPPPPTKKKQKPVSSSVVVISNLLSCQKWTCWGIFGVKG